MVKQFIYSLLIGASLCLKDKLKYDHDQLVNDFDIHVHINLDNQNQDNFISNQTEQINNKIELPNDEANNGTELLKQDKIDKIQEDQRDFIQNLHKQSNQVKEKLLNQLKTKDEASSSVIFDFNNKYPWTVACTTSESPPIPERFNDKKEIQQYNKLRATADSQGSCARVPEKVAATVPGEIHQQLHTAGILDKEILWRFETRNQTWVTFQKWTYETKFDLDKINVMEDYILQLSGVSVIANVSINGHQIGYLDNLYRQYFLKMDPEILKDKSEGSNILKVDIESTVKYTYIKQANYTQQPAGADDFQWDFEWLIPSYVSQARTQANDFGWDWSPAIAPQGIFGDVKLLREQRIELMNPIVNYNVKITENKTVAEIEVYGQFRFVGKVKQQFNLKADLSFESKSVGQLEKQIETSNIQNGDHVQKVLLGKITLENPNLWWPKEFGQQPLYDMVVKAKFMDTKTINKKIKLGIRKAQLVQDKIVGDPRGGKTFYFKINDQPVYMKGSNMVPLDYYPDRMYDEEYLEWLFLSAQEANYNIIRIWAGGMYMTDRFYEMADEKGMLIWQDAMFSCKYYPYQDEDFVRNSIIETREQIGRLQHHGSIVMWVINNEGDDMMHWNGEKEDAKVLAVRKQYTHFYIDNLLPVMRESGIKIEENFMDSTPSNGVQSFEPYVKNWLASPTQNQTIGDVHKYYLREDCELDSIHDWPRFQSESGLQSEPSFMDYKSVSLPEDWAIESEFVQKRTTFNQAHKEMVDQSRKHYIIPKDTTADEEHFSYYIWLSQLQQGRCLQTSFEKQRRGRSIPEIQNMGAIYWQFQADWQSATWATIDYSGNWKISHNMVKNTFAPLVISAYFDREGSVGNPANPYVKYKNQLNIWTMNDNLHKFENCFVNVQLFTFNQTTAVPVKSHTFNNLTINAAGSQQIGILLNSDLFPAECPQENCIVRVSLMQDKNPEPLSITHAFATYLKDGKIASAPQPSLTVTEDSGPIDHDYGVIVKNKEGSVPAIYTSLETTIPGYFTENAFTLLPGEEKKVKFVKRSKHSPGMDIQMIKLRSYNDMLRFV